jgi:phosphatidylglycerol lysyltransferase
VRRCGAEAWLRPQDFSPEGAARRQLRRKLRQADRARLVVERLAVPLPWAVLEEVDAAWRDARGAARGACMGRLCPTATARQVIFAARVEGRMLAYVSLHATPREWTLDLMRARPDAPDGTMHALVAAAIAAAAEAGVPRLSLAAVPEQRLPGPLARLFDRTTCAAGLRQFKASFAPNWTPLYAAAPSGPALALGLVDLAREIVAPS